MYKGISWCITHKNVTFCILDLTDGTSNLWTVKKTSLLFNFVKDIFQASPDGNYSPSQFESR